MSNIFKMSIGIGIGIVLGILCMFLFNFSFAGNYYKGDLDHRFRSTIASTFQKQDTWEDILEDVNEAFFKGYITEEQMQNFKDKYYSKIYYAGEVTNLQLEQMENEVDSELNYYKYLYKSNNLNNSSSSANPLNNSTNSNSSQNNNSNVGNNTGNVEQNVNTTKKTYIDYEKQDTWNDMSEDLNEAVLKGYITEAEKKSLSDTYYSKVYTGDVTKFQLERFEEELDNLLDSYENAKKYGNTNSGNNTNSSNNTNISNSSNSSTSSNSNYMDYEKQDTWNDMSEDLNEAVLKGYITEAEKKSLSDTYHAKVYTDDVTKFQLEKFEEELDNLLDFYENTKKY